MASSRNTDIARYPYFFAGNLLMPQIDLLRRDENGTLQADKYPPNFTAFEVLPRIAAATCHTPKPSFF